MKKLTVALLAIALISPVLSYAQTPPQQDDQIKLGATEVMLDVVVRDKKGHVVKDLKQSDFEVYEDNVKQDVSSFRLVLREASEASELKTTTTPSTTTTPKSGRDPFAEISLIAMVFDSLSPAARGLAHKAALSFVDESLKPDDLTTICAIDLSLHVIQPYTNDRELLRKGVDRAASLATSTAESGSAQRRTSEERSATLATQTDAAQAGAAGSRSIGTGTGQAMMDQALAEMNVRAMQTFEMLERDQQGYAKTDALLALVNSLQNVPGRKAIVFFSEGLPVPPDVSARFRTVINAANKANVTVYSIDAAGLRVESATAESARELAAMGSRRIRQQASGQTDTSGRPMTMQLERNEDVLRLNPKSSLTELSNETGGFLISDTNDLKAGLRRIDEDMRAHYVLTYAPKNQSLDGRFRQINVKLARSGMEVQTRKGYLAVPATGGSPVLDYEAPALAALSTAAQSTAFPLRTLGFSFPEPKHAGLAPVLVEVPANAFSYTPAADKKTFATDFTIIAVIKDKDQKVVGKLSQHYQLNGPIEQLEAAKRGDILFYKQVQLSPGHYTINVAAYDAPTRKVSTRATEVEIPAADESKLRISSVVILKRAEQLKADETKGVNPFQYGDLLIYPNLDEPISKAAMKQLPFYFNVYVPAGAKLAPQFTLEVMQKGQSLARLPANLPAADATGRIQYASALPLDNFQPGSYELKITVSDGQSTVSKAARFTVAP